MEFTFSKNDLISLAMGALIELNEKCEFEPQCILYQGIDKESSIGFGISKIIESLKDLRDREFNN